MPTRVIRIDSKAQISSAAKRGARALRSGKLVAFPTETVYGLGAIATDPDAMNRLRKLKSRPKGPFTVHIGDRGDVVRYVKDVPPMARRLIAKAWPGPVTILLPTHGKLADRTLQSAGLHGLLSHEGSIGLRCPDNLLAQGLLSAAKAPVVAPSANLAGQPSPRTAAEVLASLDGKIDLLLDDGLTRLGEDSTIIRFSDDEWKLLRAGPYSERAIRKMLHRRVVFVCTGNTCRSPMAAGLAKKLLADREQCRIGDLRKYGLEVVSAGLFAGDGSRATPEAVRAAKTRGADISRHRSRKLTSELTDSADVIFCMTEFHVSGVRRVSPSAANKVHRLHEDGDIPDPIGGGLDVYRQTAEGIEEALQARLDEEAL